MGAGRTRIYAIHECGRLPTFGVVSIMKSLCFIAFSLAMSMSAQASQNEPALDAVGSWLHQRAMQAAMQEASAMGRSSASVGSYQMAHRSTPELRQRLPQPPSRLESSLLGAAEMIGMEPSGALEGGKSSGLSRFYRLEGVGIVEFSENNFLAAGMQIEVIAEAQNTVVDGKPAHLGKVVDSVGRTRVELAWTGDSKTYSLTVTGEPGSDVERNARVLHDIAAAIVD
ncbi:MAG: hypothetical protein DI592_06070 [Stenotrophomonas maltophilia]|nr:MAG: hypothetical protein DI592_06070 [Stenotrophomonas maltophilia]